MPMEVPDNDSFHTCFVIDQCVRHEQWKRKLIQITKIYQMLNSVCFIHWCGDVEADNHMFCVEFTQCHRCICALCEQRRSERCQLHTIRMSFWHSHIWRKTLHLTKQQTYPPNIPFTFTDKMFNLLRKPQITSILLNGQKILNQPSAAKFCTTEAPKRIEKSKWIRLNFIWFWG